MSSPATEVDVDGVAVRLTSPDKVFFPDLGGGGRKLAMFDYYVRMAGTSAEPGPLLRALHRRPTFLQRFPDGITGDVGNDDLGPRVLAEELLGQQFLGGVYGAGFVLIFGESLDQCQDRRHIFGLRRTQDRHVVLLSVAGLLEAGPADADHIDLRPRTHRATYPADGLDQGDDCREVRCRR